MAAADWPNSPLSTGEPAGPPADHDPPARAPAWELVDAGRYRPRRTRGSFPGRELG
jgi:hypothetical protein